MNTAFLRRLSNHSSLVTLTTWAVLLMLPSAQGQTASRRGTVDPKPTVAYEYYDVRDTEATSSTSVRSAYRARQLTGSRASTLDATRQNMSDALAKLATRVPALQTETNPFGTAPEIVGTADAKAFLTAPSSAPHEQILREFLAAHAAVYGLTPADAAALIKVSDYANPAGNLSWVGLKQEINGLPVFQGELLAAFTTTGALARTTSNLAVGFEAASLPAIPALTPGQAASKAAMAIGYSVQAEKFTVNSTAENNRVAYLSFGPFVKEIKTELVYFPLEPAVATLAYAMTLWEPVNVYYILVDANDGTLLWRKSGTADQTQAATYNVYTGVSPTPLTPSAVLPGQGTQPAQVPRVNVTLVADDLVASPLGWITDGSNTTVGNNAKAGIDVDGANGIDFNVTGTNRVFSFDYNPAPGLSGAAGSTTPSDAIYRNGIVTNLFFWTNRYHDRLWNLGFTEPAHNFQTVNTFSGTNRGGTAGDAVLAEAQDSGGFNNANFGTTSDGTIGRMQMYIFNNTTPNRDGSLDGDVFIHELTHGTSIRLHSNGSGLGGTQGGGMGEGWSDYYARCLLSRADEDVNAIFPSGGYVTYQLSSTYTDNYYYGIRVFPYAVKANLGANGKPHNPETFGILDLLTINGLSNGAYPSSPVIGITANEVHNIGVFWCTTLLEMRARFITRLGYLAGNSRALQIVTDAMKLDPSNPTLLQARDSIIAADNAAYAGDDVADIRSAFAIRGMGAGATLTGTTLFTVTESFYPGSVPTSVVFSDSLGNGNGVADPGEDLTFTVQLTNRLTTTDNPIAVLGNTTANYGPLAANAFASKTFVYHVPASTPPGTLLQVPLSVTSANGSVSAPVPVRVGSPTVNVALAENFDGVTAPALPTGWTLTGGTVTNSAWKTQNTTVIDAGNSAFAADVVSTSDSGLVSPVITLGSGQQLSFKHRYTFETGSGTNSYIGYDAGVLEISIAGAGFTDIISAGGAFVQGGYGYNIGSSATGNPLIGRRAWSATIAPTSTVVVNLPPAAAGKSVQFRWREGCDSATGATGWYVDSVQIFSTTYAVTTIDSDGDGIPNGYEILYGLNPNDPTDAAGDLDGDGVSNLDEFLAGTDPKSAASRLAVTASTYDATTGLSVSFPTVSGKTYQLEYKDNLAATTWTLLPATYVGTNSPVSVTFSPAELNNQPARFFRVRVAAAQP